MDDARNTDAQRDETEETTQRRLLPARRVITLPRNTCRLIRRIDDDGPEDGGEPNEPAPSAPHRRWRIVRPVASHRVDPKQ